MSTIVIMNYQSNIEPECNPTLDHQPVNLTFFFIVYHLMGIDEVAQTMSLKGVTAVTWNDKCAWEKLASSNKISNETGYHYVEPEKIWRPVIHLQSSPDVIPIHANAQNTLVTLLKDGNVVYAPTGTWTTTCVFNFRFYPFDVQSCTFTFEMWTQENFNNITETNVRISSRVASDTYVWQIVDSSMTLTKNCYPVSTAGTFCSSQANFKITAKRTGENQRTELFVTCISLSLLMALAVAIPVDAHERVSYSVTLLLALAILQAQIKSEIPKTTETILIVVYINVNVITGSIVTAYAVLSLGIFIRLTKAIETQDKGNLKRVFRLFRFFDVLVFAFTTLVFVGLVLMFVICFGFGLK